MVMLLIVDVINPACCASSHDFKHLDRHAVGNHHGAATARDTTGFAAMLEEVEQPYRGCRRRYILENTALHTGIAGKVQHGFLHSGNADSYDYMGEMFWRI
ncbi:hypothetical protein [Massilia sp. BKSP1R2A-1]|uniref:hypothetical protein n=1 Tax=Massilia sp. BKSP1R2A-1 TaxID=3422595 RepID=UPI003D339D2E